MVYLYTLGLWMNKAKNSHLWIPLNLTRFAAGTLLSYHKNILNHSRLCPSQIQLASLWQCKGIEGYLQAGVSQCKQSLTFGQCQTLWRYVRGGRALSSGHWVFLPGRAAPWAFYVCQCRWHKPEGCARGQPDPPSTQNLICTLNIVHGMDVPCVSTACLYWVISAIGSFSVLNTDKITEDDNRFAGLPQANTSSWFC